MIYVLGKLAKKIAEAGTVETLPPAYSKRCTPTLSELSVGREREAALPLTVCAAEQNFFSSDLPFHTPNQQKH